MLRLAISEGSRSDLGRQFYEPGQARLLADLGAGSANGIGAGGRCASFGVRGSAGSLGGVQDGGRPSPIFLEPATSFGCADALCCETSVPWPEWPKA